MVQEMAERNERGQFTKGHKGGPGRPPKATEQEYLDAFCEEVPLAQWRKLIAAQVRRAERGDLQAFGALANYLAPRVDKKDINLTAGLAIEGFEEMLRRVYGQPGTDAS